MPRRKRPGKGTSESGEPGGGAGRRDEDVGGSGVYPASGVSSPKGAEVRVQGEWGKGAGGKEGGLSELNPLELGLTEEDLDEIARQAEQKPSGKELGGA